MNEHEIIAALRERFITEETCRACDNTGMIPGANMGDGVTRCFYCGRGRSIAEVIHDLTQDALPGKVYKKCGSCGVLRRVEKDQTKCGLRRPNNERVPEYARGKPCTGYLRLDEGCHAVIFHGPGHQSTSRCHKGAEPHDVHEANLAGQYAEWTGDEGITGYFDEPPVIA